MSEAPLRDPGLQNISGVVVPHVSFRQGIKGAAAAAWLGAQGVPAPDRPNAVTRWAGGRCLRLGNTEYLVEHDTVVGALDTAPADGAWTLIRSDHCVVLHGAHWPHALSHACSFDFDRLHEDPDQVVMTLFAGIAITLIREDHAPLLALRLWCDASFATYLHHCLDQLAATRPPGEQR